MPSIIWCVIYKFPVVFMFFVQTATSVDDVEINVSAMH